jgi:DNA-binding XRE family transcriptional regulator
MLNEILEQRGIKKKWLAEKVGVTPTAMTKICKGESVPHLKIALRIADVLELTVEEIWGYLK